MLWNVRSQSCLKLTFQILLVFHPWDSVFIDNCNMTLDSVKNHCLLSYCKIASKDEILNVLLTLKIVMYYFRLEHHYQHHLFCSNFWHFPGTSALFRDQN